MSRQRLLLIEDDPAVRELASLTLMEAGFHVDALDDAPDPDLVQWDLFHVVILDIGLPSADGIELSQLIRKHSNVPIIMLTARDRSEDVVSALEAGADDYVTKPFDAGVLAARARAAARRHIPGAGDVRVQVDNLVIDQREFRAVLDGTELELSATELGLLTALAARPGEVLTRQQLLEEVWGYDYLGDSRLVDMAILRLRAKLRAAVAESSPGIVTVRGQGYRLEPAAH